MEHWSLPHQSVLLDVVDEVHDWCSPTVACEPSRALRSVGEGDGLHADELVGRCCRAGPFWRQDRKILSPHGSRPNSKDRGCKMGSHNAIVAICFGLLGPFKP